MIDLSITIMKRSVINLIAILLFCNVQLVRAEDVDNCYLCIQGSSGEEQSFPIDEINKITFSPDAMVIHLKGDVEDGAESLTIPVDGGVSLEAVFQRE